MLTGSTRAVASCSRVVTGDAIPGRHAVPDDGRSEFAVEVTAPPADLDITS
jgi:hypothetical protein